MGQKGESVFGLSKDKIYKKYKQLLTFYTMKKLFALLALVLGMVSCQTEPEALDVVVGGEQEVMLSVSLPESTRANSAEGFDLNNLNGYKVRYILEISYNGNLIRDFKITDATTAKFPVRLAPNRDYTFTVWADLVTETEVENWYDADLYYNTEGGLKNIYFEDWTPNTEARDAWTATQTVTYTSSNKNIGLELKRPFAKVRVVATDIQEIRKFGIEPTNAVATYTQEMYTEFDAVAGAAKGTTTGKTLEFAYTGDGAVDTYDDATGELTLFADYVLVPADGNVQFTLSVFDSTKGANALIKTNNFNTTIPVVKNKVTTIKGNVLTEGGDVSITVNGELGEGETINYVEVDNAEELVDAIENIENGMIKLGEDVNLDDLLNADIPATRAEKQYGLQIPANKTVILDLNGKKIYQTKEQSGKYAMIENNGTLTICNSANTVGTLSYGDTATLTADVGYASNTIQNNGVLTINEGVVIKNTSGEGVATYGYPHVIDTNGTLTINGGTLTNEANYSTMRIWTSNTDAEKCKVTINGGTFNGCIDFQAHNNNYATMPHYGTLTVNGGTFNADTFTKSAIRVLRFAVNANDMHATINGGTFNGKVWVRNIGTFESTPKIFDIYNGTFTTMYEGFDTLLALGYAFVEGENGTYTVENVGHYTDAEGNYHITNAKGLAWVSENVNTMKFYVNKAANIFDDKTVYLDNDIDLGGAEWRPIGDYAFSRTSFNGVFDGQGYTVSNFKVTEPVRWTEKVTEASYGFFGNVKGTIKNLTIKNATVTPEGGRYTGVLVGRLHNGGRIENCHVENSTVTILHWQVGGLVGQNNNGNIYNCSVVGSTITGKAAVGAIVGMDMTNGEHTIENCRVANTALVQNESFGASYDASYGLAVGLVNASGIVLNVENVVAENNTIMGVAADTLVGDIETGATVTINGVSIITTAEQLAAAIKAGGNYLLGADIAMTAATYQNVDVTIDGNGHTISQVEGSTNEYALFDSVTGKLTLKNIVFDGIKDGAVLRTTGAELTMDNVTVKNCEHTKPIYGLFRLIGKNTIKNSKFYDNKCISVITFNTEGDDNTDPQIVQNCEFKNNTCSATAVVHYSTGGGVTINGNKFVNNTLTVSNGATVYLGFKKNCTVTNNLFDGNTVTATSKRSAGGLMVGNAAVVTGNAFVNNTVTVNGATGYGNDVCASPYYAAIDLSGNYWGGGAPVENDDYYKEFNNYEVIINDYLTENPIK